MIGRPQIPSEPKSLPVLYLGGRIYDDGKWLRCFRQIGDRIEKSIGYKLESRTDSYEKAFVVIEIDDRVKAKMA